MGQILGLKVRFLEAGFPKSESHGQKSNVLFKMMFSANNLAISKMIKENMTFC